jgi:hypothetical protein
MSRKTLIGGMRWASVCPGDRTKNGISDMRVVFSAAMAVWLGVAGGAMAQDAAPGPVVVELYTSQGCSSCPPADEIFAGLTTRPDVIALALHVDYWDYIGWKDSFALPQFTERQRAYAREAGARTIYTPQMIVGGLEHLVGVRPAELAAMIARHGAMPAKVAMQTLREGGAVRITATPIAQLPQGTLIQLVRYRPEASVEIRGGENAGRLITYHNIVTEWRRVGTWDGASPLSLSVDVAPGDNGVVILQEPGPGPIIAAARLP